MDSGHNITKQLVIKLNIVEKKIVFTAFIKMHIHIELHKCSLVKHGHDQHPDHYASIAIMACKGVQVEKVLRVANRTL